MKARILIVILYMLTATTSFALSSDAETDTIFEASVCPLLFGNEDQIRDNERSRKNQFLSITERNDYYEVSYMNDWDQPEVMSFQELTLVDTVTDSDNNLSIIVNLSHTDDDFDCPNGLYQLHVDNNIGEQGQIIEIFNDLVVFVYEGNLHYMSFDESYYPEWKMVWVSNWNLIYLKTGKTTSTSGKATRNRSRRRNRR